MKPESKHASRSIWLCALLFFLIAGCGEAPKPLPKLYPVPQFTLTERSGQPFDSASLRGKVWVADFFFTNCIGTCLILSNNMGKVHQAFRDEPGVRYGSISTDSNNDTPAVLRDYASRMKADDRWAFLTGEHDSIFELSIEGFKLALVEQPDDVSIADKFIHSTKLVLVDKTGTIRAYYNGVGETADAEHQRLVADIKRLLAE